MSLLDGLDDCAAYIAATPLRLVGYFGPTEKSPILAIPLYFLFPFAACFIPSLWQEMARLLLGGVHLRGGGLERKMREEWEPSASSPHI